LTLSYQNALKIFRKALFHATSTRFISHEFKYQVSQLYNREERQYVCIRYSADISFRLLPITFKMLFFSTANAVERVHLQRLVVVNKNYEFDSVPWQRYPRSCFCRTPSPRPVSSVSRAARRCMKTCHY